MRTKLVAKNTIFSFISEVVLLVFGMIMPRLIILKYGSDVNGLTSTVNQILSILNLLQAGAVGASIYAMFKPVAEGDKETVGRIMYSSRQYFRKLGMIFLCILVVISPVVAFLKMGQCFQFWEIAISMLILGVNGSFYFFFVAWYDILFSSYQERFWLSIGGIFEKLTYYGLLFAILNSSLSFMWMYVAVLIGNIIKILYLWLVYRKKYKDRVLEYSGKEPYVIKNKGFLLAVQISTQSVDASPVIILTALFDFNLVSVFAVYNLVLNMEKMVINTVQYSFSASLGNLIAAENDKRVADVFDLIELVCTLLGMWMSICTAVMLSSFIVLYTSGINDVEYYRPMLTAGIVLFGVCFSFYAPYAQLTNGYGLFKATYLQSVICGVVSIVISFLCAQIHMELVLLGPIFYYISGYIFRMMVIAKKSEWFDSRKTILRDATTLIITAVAFFIGRIICVENSNWMSFFAICIVVAVIAAGIVMLYLVLFERKQIKVLASYVKTTFHH